MVRSLAAVSLWLGVTPRMKPFITSMRIRAMSIPSLVSSRMYSESVMCWVLVFSAYECGTRIEHLYACVKSDSGDCQVKVREVGSYYSQIRADLPECRVQGTRAS